MNAPPTIADLGWHSPADADQSPPSKAVPGTTAIVFGRTEADRILAKSYAQALNLNIVNVVHWPGEAVGWMAETDATSVFTTMAELDALGPQAAAALRAAVEQRGGELHAGDVISRHPTPASARPPTPAKAASLASLRNGRAPAADGRYGP